MLKYARLSNGRIINADYYRKDKHGIPYCPYCEGRVSHRVYLKPKKELHFWVPSSFQSSHSCKFFSNKFIESYIHKTPSDTFKIRRNGLKLTIDLNFEGMGKIKEKRFTKGNSKESDNQVLPRTIRSISTNEYSRLKRSFRFIQDMFELIKSNEREKILNITFKVNGQKYKAKALIPLSLKDVIDDKKNRELKRFFVRPILSAKQFNTGTINVTMKGTRLEDGSFINAEVVFLKEVVAAHDLHIFDFRQNRILMVYGKPSIKEEENKITLFVNKPDEFEFGKLTALDGHLVNSKDEFHIDNYFHYQDISHEILSYEDGKLLFPVDNGIDQFYIPDWLLIINDKPIIVEYFGFYTEEYQEKKMRKINYFSHLNDYLFIPLEKIDIENDFKGLSDKLRKLIPGINLKPFKYLG